jgi:hypothetical protein
MEAESSEWWLSHQAQGVDHQNYWYHGIEWGYHG